MMALTRTLKNVSKRKRKKAGQIDTDLDVFGDLIRRANADDSSLIVKWHFIYNYFFHMQSL